MKKYFTKKQPTTELVNYSQTKIIAVINQYIDLKRAKMPSTTLEERSLRAKCRLPFASIKGFCNGLLAYFLYNERMFTPDKFIKLLRRVLAWDAKIFQDSSETEDPFMEEFINIIAFLQHDSKLRPTINQNNMASSFALLLDDLLPQVDVPEFSVTFVFTVQTLADLIRALVVKNKLVRVDNVFHVVGFMFNGKNYKYFDSLSESAPKIYETPEALAVAIFKGLTPFCGSKKYLGINITICDFVKNDLSDYDAVEYPTAMQIYRELLQDPHCKVAFINHKNILRLGIRFDDFEMLDLLFTSNYVYKLWTYNKTTELNEAIYFNNEKRLRYLLDHNIPVNYRVKNVNGYTPLGTAIIHQRSYMMFLLLLAGANPQLFACDGTTHLELAISRKNTAAIILLLAWGVDFTKDDIELMSVSYGEDLKTIVAHAIDLNAVLFNSTTELNITTKDRKRDIKLSYDARLKQHLGDLQLNRIKSMKIDCKASTMLFSAAGDAERNAIYFDNDVAPLLTLTML